MLFKKNFTILRKNLQTTNRYFNTKSLYKTRNEDDFEILALMGKGSTSMVYLGYDILNQEKVTLKLIKKEILLEKIIK